MNNYGKYVELNELMYEGKVMGYRVSFYVIVPSGVTSRVLFKKCDTFEKVRGDLHVKRYDKVMLYGYE